MSGVLGLIYLFLQALIACRVRRSVACFGLYLVVPPDDLVPSRDVLFI